MEGYDGEMARSKARDPFLSSSALAVDSVLKQCAKTRETSTNCLLASARAAAGTITNCTPTNIAMFVSLYIAAHRRFVSVYHLVIVSVYSAVERSLGFRVQ